MSTLKTSAQGQAQVHRLQIVEQCHYIQQGQDDFLILEQHLLMCYLLLELF